MQTVNVNGADLNYEELGSPSGEPFVYLAYTRFDSAAMWVPFFTEHASDFRVIIPDARGMGKSTHTEKINPAIWVSDLVALFDDLGISKAHVCSETLGSRIATRFAADHPDRVKTLIVNGAIAYSSPEGDAERAKSASTDKMAPERRDLMKQLHGDDWEAVNVFYQKLHDQDDFKSFYDLREASPRVTVPSLVMRGDRDEPIHPVSHSMAIYERIPGAWLAIYPNTPFNALRAHPKEAWSLIREFIAANS